MRILFISHDASRTGAPVLLLRLLKELVKQRETEISVLLRSGGELENEFASVGKVYLWNKPSKKSLLTRIISRILNIFHLQFRPDLSKLNGEFFKDYPGFDVIFSNTITNASLLRQFSLDGKKVFFYFHELEVITEIFCSREDVEFQGQVAENIFVPSMKVRDFLVEKYGLTPGKFLILNYLLPDIKPEITDLSGKQKIKDTDNNFVVGLCGTMHWRKGSDMLPQLIKIIVCERSEEEIRFLWIGANKYSQDFLILINDLSKLGLSGYFGFTEPAQDINGYLAQLDVFLLLSREDTFPLVVLESAALGIPSVCFRKSGGAVDFVEPDAGLTCDYLDLNQVADKILQLKHDHLLRKKLGENAKSKVEKYSNSQMIVENLLKELKVKV